MKVALGVSGGIAAYKAAELVRLLQDRGLRVQVIMTHAAQEFVRPLTFAALSGDKVITDMFGERNSEPNVDSAVEHIAVAGADALVVAPATANIVAKFAHGIADDFLTTLYLATTAPVIVAPAMNVNMWDHPATRANLEVLRGRGVRVVEPGSGYLACGMIGAGRLADLDTIVDAVVEALRPQDLKGETIVITAGPTREPIDPVRYISNRSSGKMGYALAEAAIRRGAKVVLVSGPTALKVPDGVEVVPVEKAADMRNALLSRLHEATVVIKAAAVADYTIKSPAREKIKRGSGPMILELDPTTDIIAEVARQKAGTNQIVVGFAAETTNVIENAQRKLTGKGLNAIVVNDVSAPGIGFDSDRNAVTIITPDEQIEVPEKSKIEVAHRILDTVLRIRQRLSESVSSAKI
ncbi:MAG TPA: bifunctional phosphopantothenoylcysteine decarboxylase/phosphopantothenate--cysteine ligase CoaBC [Terriglobales bacterium]|nr:bifunctional phosphopantothenoylcysteine decarboxylase/phosphopantothenate--cysteine ligase CoaBC [Terriglobales bacterium]